METKQLIELVTDVLAKEWVDWRPVIERIEEESVDIDAPCSEKGWTLLQWALESDNNQVASFAISRGASINAKGKADYDCTPLDVAVRKGNDTYVDMFIRHGGTGSLPATSKRTELVARGKEVLGSLRAISESDSFSDAVRHYEKTLGVAPKRDKASGFSRFRKISLVDVLSLTGKRSEQLAQILGEFASFSEGARERNSLLYFDGWLGESLRKTDLILAPTNSDIEFLTAMAAVPDSPLCGNFRLYEPLLELYEIQKFRILSINGDAIVVRFVDKVDAFDELVAHVVKLFPFLRDYHTAGAGNRDDVDVSSLLADEIRDDNAIHIIYHSF